MANFGPRDNSVLYGQSTHISEDVPTGNTVSLLYLRHMQDIHEDGVSNWGVAVLAYLYKELCTSSQRHKVNIELMPTIIDEENILPHPPYAARWSYHLSRTHAAHNAVRIIRNTFDRMKQNEFIWTPYGGEGPDVQSLPIYALRTPWHIKCPLIHYAIVEIHHPERVLRQFGMIQDIPPNPPAERVGQMIIDYNRVPMDFHSVVQLMTSHHQTHQEIMNFLETRYHLFYRSPLRDCPSNARDEAGPSNARNEASPSNAYIPTNTAYTVDSDNSYLPFIGDESTYTVTPDHRIYHGISPVPFEDLDVPSQNSVSRQEQVPRRNRRCPRCGTGGHY
ncbi:hypothetical protein Sango_2070000 [Sesamum angolense]|uniref:Aminotransferase-like plant mobile domain-containing protein n=1 Tax=Sesamum angolense TaxID=2727404 RepID=A0AAE1WB01_9LAMI|nr:hypothetical protein Sango_2070000 [Sesamum angolense]